jgi:hypothetical protein
MDDQIPESTRRAIDQAVHFGLRHSGRPGHAIVHDALTVCRAELVAVVGHRGAAALLRNLAQALDVEAEDLERDGD